MRITKKHLEAKVQTINNLLDRPKTPYTRVDGKLKANIGNFSLSMAYGGYSVHEMTNEQGGVSTIINIGHIPARELALLLDGFVAGIMVNKG